MANYNGIGNQIIEDGIFERFPELIPFVGDNYWHDKQSKLLLICESNYFEDDLKSRIFKDAKEWYHGANSHRDRIPEGMIKNVNNAGKLFYLKGLLNSMQKQLNTAQYDDIAFHNYFLRPASVKNKNGKKDIGFKKDYTDLDGEVAFAAFCGILESIQPDIVIFASALAWEKMEFFKNKHDKNFGKIAIEKVSHPSSAWWNKSNGVHGRQKFEDLLWVYWIRPIDPKIKAKTNEMFDEFKLNPFWNKEIWDDINCYDEKDATCAYFDNTSKNISIDIYCAENDKYQFQIFEREKFKATKPSGLEWIQSIPNLTTKGSRYESRLQSREDIKEILENLMN
jgi:hypothetical protein